MNNLIEKKLKQRKIEIDLDGLSGKGNDVFLKELINEIKNKYPGISIHVAMTVYDEYIKEIKGPFNDIELLACGGVTPENIAEYFDKGASAIAFGASIFRQEWLKAGDFKSISSALTALISAKFRKS